MAKRNVKTTNEPKFNASMAYGSGTFIISDADGQLWRIDSDAGTATKVAFKE